MRWFLHTFWKVTNCVTKGDNMDLPVMICIGTCNLCVQHSRSSGSDFCMNKGIRFSLENNKPLFPAGSSTPTIFRREGWYFGGKKGHSFGFSRFKVSLFCFVWEVFQWLNSENICGLMADPWVACPNLGEKNRCVVWAHDHQPGIECFRADSARHCPDFGPKGLQARAVSRRQLTDSENLNAKHIWKRL